MEIGDWRLEIGDSRGYKGNKYMIVNIATRWIGDNEWRLETGDRRQEIAMMMIYDWQHSNKMDWRYKI